ncbi:MAG TPA: MarR family transcriptional regulator [Bryobacteraceae bacterium]|nr:MarR family transcriptional regulator [Bryobacteraceae bacterium]
MTKREGNPAAAQLWIVLARCHRAVSALVERSVADLGLCLSDFMVLEALLHKGPLTISDIQAKVLLASGSMTAAVDRLENRNLIVRKTTASDRRARVLELTPEGRLMIQRAFREHSEDLDRVMSVLDNNQKQELYAALKKLGQFAAEALKGNTAAEKIS